MNDFYSIIRKVIPDFDSGRCHWIRRFEPLDVPTGTNWRLVLDYNGRIDVSLKISGVTEMPVFKPATAPGVPPYAPYDLGEFFITSDPKTNRVILFDELKARRLVADSVAFETATDQVTPTE